MSWRLKPENVTHGEVFLLQGQAMMCQAIILCQANFITAWLKQHNYTESPRIVYKLENISSNTNAF